MKTGVDWQCKVKVAQQNQCANFIKKRTEISVLFLWYNLLKLINSSYKDVLKLKQKLTIFYLSHEKV